jgi:hypothetical protein
MNKFGDATMSWSRMEELVESIYEGMISEDPYEPQEIKLALADDSDAMKVTNLNSNSNSNPNSTDLG